MLSKGNIAGTQTVTPVTLVVAQYSEIREIDVKKSERRRNRKNNVALAVPRQEQPITQAAANGNVASNREIRHPTNPLDTKEEV